VYSNCIAGYFIGVFKLTAKLNPQFGLMAMLSLAASVALLGAGQTASASPHAATALDQASVDVSQDPSSGTIATDWTMTSLDDAAGFTERLLGDGRADRCAPNEYVFVSEGTVPPAPETPSEARVPEPTTLALLGSGMIAMARAARRKWSFRRMHASRIGRALTEEAL
jgi:PEP-CTERM motif